MLNYIQKSNSIILFKIKYIRSKHISTVKTPHMTVLHLINQNNPFTVI